MCTHFFHASYNTFTTQYINKKKHSILHLIVYFKFQPQIEDHKNSFTLSVVWFVKIFMLQVMNKLNKCSRSGSAALFTFKFNLWLMKFIWFLGKRVAGVLIKIICINNLVYSWKRNWNAEQGKVMFHLDLGKFTKML